MSDSHARYPITLFKLNYTLLKKSSFHKTNQLISSIRLYTTIYLQTELYSIDLIYIPMKVISVLLIRKFSETEHATTLKGTVSLLQQVDFRKKEGKNYNIHENCYCILIIYIKK